MLRIDSTNINYNASSIINDDDIIANFSAGINDPSESMYISIGANNFTIFKNNLSIIKSDLNDFLDSLVE